MIDKLHKKVKKKAEKFKKVTKVSANDFYLQKGGFVINFIALKKEEEVLDYLCNGLENSPDTSAARCDQQKGLEVFRKTMMMQTVRCMQDNEFHRIYQNSFSRCRSRFDEYSRVSLTSKKRR